jgi:uncharacterized metal-binding protein YceD (DUF177 family)
MMIDVSKINHTERFEILGNEEWLENIYKSFPPPPKMPSPKIKATIDVDARDPACVNVKGEVEYTPYVDCSKCGLEITWPLHEKIDTKFLKDLPTMDGEEMTELELEAHNLDEYILVNGKFFNLETLINDAIHLALPTKLVKKDDQDNCLVCFKDTSGFIAISTDHDRSKSPFDALKNLKLDS